FNRVDRGEKVGTFDGPVVHTGLVTRYKNATPEKRTQLRRQFAVEDPRESGLFRAGQALRRKTAEVLPVDPAREDKFETKLARGLGSTAGFLGAGLIGRATRAGALPVAALSGAAAGAANQFQQALTAGASIEDATEAAKLSAMVGTSEALPIARLLGRVDKASGGTIRRILTRTIAGGFEEGIQETGQQIADNLIASKLVAFDPERETFTGAGEGGAVGFTTGALFNFVAAAFGVRTRGARTRAAPATTPQDAQPAAGQPQTT
ncbi:MAG: hypothetical protein IIC36_10545, partial [Gemmatimonadetes bacterium]|nr:hypothetical protein [Gemmatimonadota bacterium]